MAAELQDQLGGTVQRMGERCEDLVMDLVDAAARTQQMLLSAESLEKVSGGACSRTGWGALLVSRAWAAAAAAVGYCRGLCRLAGQLCLGWGCGWGWIWWRAARLAPCLGSGRGGAGMLKAAKLCYGFMALSACKSCPVDLASANQRYSRAEHTSLACRLTGRGGAQASACRRALSKRVC